MPPKLSKSEAIASIRREHPALKLESNTTHFASINAGKDVWWFDIPCKKVIAGHHAVLDILVHDHRSNELHHLVVPTQYFRDNFSKLVVRKDKDTISLELSASSSNFLRDIRPAGGQVAFAQFRQKYPNNPANVPGAA